MVVSSYKDYFRCYVLGTEHLTIQICDATSPQPFHFLMIAINLVGICVMQYNHYNIKKTTE